MGDVLARRASHPGPPWHKTAGFFEPLQAILFLAGLQVVGEEVSQVGTVRLSIAIVIDSIADFSVRQMSRRHVNVFGSSPHTTPPAQAPPHGSFKQTRGSVRSVQVTHSGLVEFVLGVVAVVIQPVTSSAAGSWSSCGEALVLPER